METHATTHLVVAVSASPIISDRIHVTVPTLGTLDKGVKQISTSVRQATFASMVVDVGTHSDHSNVTVVVQAIREIAANISDLGH